MERKKKALVIVNPRAGRLRVKSQLFNIADYFSQNDIETTLYTTSGQGDAKNFAKDLAKDYDFIVARGGDGTLNEVVNGLMASGVQRPIGYIPSGTTNDFAATMGIPVHTKKAIELIIKNEPKAHDLGLMNDEMYFTYTASFGLFTRAAYATPQGYKNLFGYYAYLLEGAKEIFKLKPIPVKITCDGEVHEGEYALVAITNSYSVGGIIKYDKDMVDFNDGKFEVLLAKLPPTIREIADLMLAVRKKEFDERYITILQGKEIICESENEIPWTIDGEYGGKHKVTTLKCLQNAMQIFSEREIKEQIEEQTEEEREEEREED